MSLVLTGLVVVVLLALFIGVMERWIERTDQARHDLEVARFHEEFTEWCAREVDDVWAERRAA